jgi:hypothetical protein
VRCDIGNEATDLNQVATGRIALHVRNVPGCFGFPYHSALRRNTGCRERRFCVSTMRCPRPHDLRHRTGQDWQRRSNSTCVKRAPLYQIGDWGISARYTRLRSGKHGRPQLRSQSKLREIFRVYTLQAILVIRAVVANPRDGPSAESRAWFTLHLPGNTL